MASADGSRAEKNSRRENAKRASTAGHGRNGISEKRLERAAENFPRQNEKLRRNRADDWPAQGRPRRGRRVWCEPGSGFGSVPSRSGREQKTRRLLRRIGLETQ